MLPDWLAIHAELREIARRQLFFVGGAPRSGTTWLQHLLDAHPEVSCQGEAHFLKFLAEPLGSLMARWREQLAEKNARVFGEVGGYPLPVENDLEAIIGTAILLALRRQNRASVCHAIGEKTPENVFFFPIIRRIFPDAKFIGIARDPRDSMTSAWHFFRSHQSTGNETAAKFALIRAALPPVARGLRMMIDFRAQFPNDVLITTYEDMSRDAVGVAAQLFRFLEVSDGVGVVTDCVRRTEFAVMSGGRPAGIVQSGAFFRRGVSGAWRDTLTEGMSDLLVKELSWAFPIFGWKP